MAETITFLALPHPLPPAAALALRQCTGVAEVDVVVNHLRARSPSG